MNARDHDLLDAIQRLTKTTGFPPTMQELAVDLRVGTTRIKQLIDRNVTHGRLSRDPRKARCYRVLKRPKPD
jgi:SOS-response transcriptional repressor LexA